MKVSELFEAQGSPGQGGTLKGGAYYKPKYLADVGQLRGSVLDWMDAMGVTKEHIAKAIAQVKGTPLFRNDLPAAGLEFTPSEGKMKKGTLTWTVKRKSPYGHTYVTRYNIYANGQIRWEAGNSPYSDGKASTSPLRSPKPRMKAGDPVGSLVMIYKASMQEMLDKWKKSKEKMDKEDAKKAKQEKK
jgi:hypothetical protein